VIALCIKLDSPGPVLFKQFRTGANGKRFKVYKFRSMKLHQEQDNKVTQASRKDPRVTPFGAFLRRTSLDELPQFYNIFIGDMSLIGPRPIVEEELSEYGNQCDKFLSVLPGAMGFWQASGRSSIPYPERCQYELYYIDNCSLWFDIKIFFKCIISIFRASGAY